VNVRWSRRARRQFNDIIRYVGSGSPSAAERLYDRIYAAEQLLSEHPNIGRRGHVPSTRDLVLAKTVYILTYRVVAREVRILTIIDGRQRRIPPMLSR
jgi:toxin ParE1/3/4